jgi:hypothetical protein
VFDFGRWGSLALVVIATLSGSGCDRSPPARTLSRAPWSPPTPIRDGDGVFFIGNSFFGWQGRSLPVLVAALGQAVSPPIRIDTGSDIVFGNHPLAEFLEHAATREALASRKYQVFVLQGEEFELGIPVIPVGLIYQWAGSARAPDESPRSAHLTHSTLTPTGFETRARPPEAWRLPKARNSRKSEEARGGAVLRPRLAR